MSVIAFDTETALIRPAMNAPEMACISWASSGQEAGLIHANDAHAHDLFGSWITSETLGGHNVAYDMAVAAVRWPDLLDNIFKAYDENRVTDTMLRQKLLDIAAGQYRGRMGDDQVWIKFDYSLESVARRVAGMHIRKDGFRLHYGNFIDVPLDGWVQHATNVVQPMASARLQMYGLPKTVITDLKGLIAADPYQVLEYPKDDARATLAVLEVQEVHACDWLKDQFRQARYAFWLHLASTWGLRTNPKGVALLRQSTEREIDGLMKTLQDVGLIRANGKRDTKAAKARMLEVCRLKELEPRATISGNISLDSDACKAVDDPILAAYAELTSLKTVINKDLPALGAASVYPIHTRFDLAETGRTTSSKPNVQNWRRLPGIRECFQPRPGKVFVQADYASLELCTLAQTCIDLFGHSKLGEAINEGLDPHTSLACSILGIDYAEGLARKNKSHPKHAEFDDARQTAKVANFGFPGGLGAAKLVLFARKTYGVILTEARARVLKQEWMGHWPEMRQYFAYVETLKGDDGIYRLEQARVGRHRASNSYTAICNSGFQGLGADATKAAGWLVSKACYIDRKSPLFGARIVNYIHDELILEADDNAQAHDVAIELSRIMVAGAAPLIPNIKLKAEPCIMRVWSKEADSLYQNGRLVPWEPALGGVIKMAEAINQRMAA